MNGKEQGLSSNQSPKQQQRRKMSPIWESVPWKKQGFPSVDDWINGHPDPKPLPRFVTVGLTNSFLCFIKFLCASVGMPQSTEQPFITILWKPIDTSKAEAA